MTAKFGLEHQFHRFSLALNFAHQEQRPLWVYIARWKRTWRTKSYGMSTLILRCYYQTRLLTPSPPWFSSGWRTRASGSLVFPVTMVCKRKPVIDTFHKWLDAYKTYMLVIVAAYPRRALELLKYHQIISRLESKFKGLAWLAYEKQFRRYAAHDLTDLGTLLT